jgi:hypothetical protein
MTTPQAKYYQSHRDEILPKMREREKQRRATRKSKYAEQPELHETDKAIARKKYYARVGRINTAVIHEALADETLPETTRAFLTQLTEDNDVSNISTVALRKMISGGNNKSMPRGKKSKDVVTGDGTAAPVVNDRPVPEAKKEIVVVAVPGHKTLVSKEVIELPKTVAKGGGEVVPTDGTKRVSKGKKEKRVIIAAPGEHLSIKVDKGVRVTFS